MLVQVQASPLKLSPVTLEFVRVTTCESGVKIYPAWEGVTVYVPGMRPVKLYLPETSAEIDCVVTPDRLTTVPAPPAPEMVPETLRGLVTTEPKFTLLIDMLFTVTVWLKGEKVTPARLGVMV
jgi:hypothetical protein